MASVHFGRLHGTGGFSRTVAIKRLHAQFAKETEFVRMFLDEARLAGRIHHPNVVQTLDVVVLDTEIFLVMEYVQGESLARLAKTAREKSEDVPLPVVSAILCGTLHGLHAAHEATDAQGKRLDIVHRDLSPHNVLVGVDGVARVIDFGIAKAVGRLQMTNEGQVKGKLAYMAPEQLLEKTVDARSDVYAAGVVLWESLAGQRLFGEENPGAVMVSVLTRPIPAPSTVSPRVPRKLDRIAMRALERDPALRFQTARDMALAIEASVPAASPVRVAEWVRGLAGQVLEERSAIVLKSERRVPAPHASRGSDTFHTAAFDPADGTLSQRGSAVSVTMDSPRPRSRPRRVARVLAGAVLLMAVAVLALAAGKKLAVRVAPAAATGPSTPPSVPPAPPPPASAPIPAEAMPAPAAPVVASVRPALPVPSPAPATSRASARPARPIPAATTTSRGTGDAKPCVVRPYVDESGFTQFVKECP
jgi:serine/threonine-protein kinase